MEHARSWRKTKSSVSFGTMWAPWFLSLDLTNRCNRKFKQMTSVDGRRMLKFIFLFTGICLLNSTMMHEMPFNAGPEHGPYPRRNFLLSRSSPGLSCAFMCMCVKCIMSESAAFFRESSRWYNRFVQPVTVRAQPDRDVQLLVLSKVIVCLRWCRSCFPFILVQWFLPMILCAVIVLHFLKFKIRDSKSSH
jgi:hypothetical protein